jgi:acyl-CoA synthetase (AMP-forming)/AMP-acid ligase II
MNEFAALTTGKAIDRIAAKYGRREALVFRDRRYSFLDIAANVRAASAWLHSQGVEPGDKISIWMPNCPEFLWCVLGAAQLGAVGVVLNTRLRLDEVAYQIDQSDSIGVITTGSATFRDFLGDLTNLAPGICSDSARAGGSGANRLPKLRFVAAIDEAPAQYEKVAIWREGAACTARFAVADDPDAPALIAYTSGTTALPKGVVLTHCIWRKGFDAGATMGISQDDRLYLCVPLFGMMGLITNGPLSWWTHGACVVLEERYDLDSFFATVARERCSIVQLMPAVMEPILQDPRFKTLDRSRWRLATVLSSHPDTLKAAVERFGFRQVVCGYGMTETTAIVTRTLFDEPFEVQIGSNGRPLPDVAINIVDPETLRELEPGEPGEICLKGYFVMKEYYKKPVETAEVLLPDGWFRTGDLGVLDAGQYLHFQGRLKDSYKTNGFNVSASEVETAIREHPAVKDAAVVAIPHPTFGDVGVAFVIPRAEANLTDADVLQQCRAKLASFKVPVRVLFVDAFPITAGTEKVQKFQLKQRALQGP